MIGISRRLSCWRENAEDDVRKDLGTPHSGRARRPASAPLRQLRIAQGKVAGQQRSPAFDFFEPSGHWVRVICGENITPYSDPEEQTSNTFGVVNAVLANELELLGEILAQDTQQQIESMRAAWREGRKDEAIQWVVGVRENHARWLALSPIAKAALLRFGCSLVGWSRPLALLVTGGHKGSYLFTEMSPMGIQQTPDL